MWKKAGNHSKDQQSGLVEARLYEQRMPVTGQFKMTLWSVVNISYGAGGMGHWLQTWAALSEDLGSIPSTHMAAHHCL